MSYFATPYTIHFDDTMAYGSHHFLTAFKFQCAAREALLYGDLIFDQPGVHEALDTIHLFTADAYSRNLGPTFLGDRVVILITLEEWGRVSARFCYRVLNRQGQPICAGFQTMICSDAKTGNPIPLPEPLRKAFDALRELTEADAPASFRDRVLAGTEATMQLFTEEVRESARQYSSDRYPHPRVISQTTGGSTPARDNQRDRSTAATEPQEDQVAASDEVSPEVWVFPGQGSFDAELLSDRVQICTQMSADIRRQLDDSIEIAAQLIGGDAAALVSGSAEPCRQAVRETPGLSQVAIYLQSVLAAKIRQQANRSAILMGHSFGEIAALSVAGCFPMHVGVRIVCERVCAIRDFGPPNGALLVATTNRQCAAEEIAASRLPQLVIAGRNHDRQTLVSGPRDQLDRLRTYLQSKSVQAIAIDSPTSFHHPQLREAAAAWLRQLDQIPIQSPTSTVYSPIGRRLISPNDDIRAVLCSQFVRPFDLQGAIDDLITGGFTRFVDCGSAGSLARLLKAAGPASILVEGVGAPTSTKSVRTNGIAVPSRRQKSDSESAATSQLATKSAVRSSAERPSTPRPPIAIVAQGCLLPGRATSPAELHAAISQGRPGIFDQRDFDADWEKDFYSPSLIPDKSTSPLAGLVDDRDIVPPDNIDPGVFAQFSRAQKLLCVALAPCVDVIRQSGKVLCLMGTSADGFQNQDNIAALRYAGIDLTDPQIIDRLGKERSVFQDPYLAVQEVLDRAVRPGLDVTLVDAACASSLYAVALGMQALENHEADVLIAGGVFCPGPGNNCLFSQFGGLTSTGCRPFDEAADGVVFSEGAAVVVLRRLADARQSSQNVAAIVRGAGLSSDGRSPSANVPQTPGQLLALKRCYANYGVDPTSVVAIEAHGTSTPVGDVTELNTLHEFFSGQAKSPILVHSLKGLLGHTGWAAGTAAVIAASEMLRTGLFPAQAGHRHPSRALLDAKKVLTVPAQPVQLRSTAGRIAIDSLGFGGANAHLVIESDVDDTAASDFNATLATKPSLPTDDSLVVVAWHQSMPTTHSQADSGVLRFDRDHIALPKGVVLLPDLADDMDVTQALALSVVGETLGLIPLTDDLRRQTGIILALEGKTERAVEATSRVLAPRLSRMFGGLPAADAIEKAARQARPSGPYTLQCMMPNVSSGRAALTFNLNGPNFVVDAGANSLEAAFRSARLLLGNPQDIGTKLIVVAAINANRWPVPNSDPALSKREYAAAFAVTTQRHAEALALDVVCPLETILSKLNSDSELTTTEEKLAACVKSLEENLSPPDPQTNVKQRKDQFPIHSPVWVETPATPRSSSPLPKRHEDWLVIAEATEETMAELVAHLPDHCQCHMVVLVGPAAAAVAAHAASPNVFAVDLLDEHSVDSALNRIRDFAPNLVMALSKNLSWDFTEALEHVSRNELSESLFLTMKQLVDKVRNGETEIWAVFPGSWRRVIHPLTGAASGLIKSVKRELPDACLGVLSHSSDSIGEVLLALQHERSLVGNHEQDVAYEGNTRLVRRLRELDTDRAPKSELRIPLDANSVVVASGGARGVTAVLAECLLRDYGCTVVALGRSQLEQGPDCFDSAEVQQEYYAKFVAENPQASPQEMKLSFESARARWEAKRTIDELAGTGGRVRYLTVDVTDRNAVDQAVEKIAAEFGKIDLIVHGAGVQWSKKLQDRSLAEFRKTFDVKINGLRHLVESCRSFCGRAVPAHLLTSAYSIFGNDGQHDYGAANETLDRLCELTKVSPEHDWTSIAWSAWDGIGMTRGSEYRALAQKRNLALLNVRAGQGVFKAVMEGRSDSKINVPLSESERTQYHVPTIPPSITAAPARSLEFPICVNKLDCLAFHKARGVPTLPGAWIVDYMVQAAMQIIDAPAEYLTIENAKFLRMVRIANNYDPNLRVIVDATPTGCHAWLIGNVLNPTGVRLSSDVVFAQATLATTNHNSQSAPSLNGMLRNGHGTVRTVDDPYCTEDQDVQLSGPFDCLPNVEIGPLGRRAIFSPCESTQSGGTIPALLLDASLRVAGMHVVPDTLHVPTRIEKVVLPIGFTTDSFAALGWQIRTCSPRIQGDEIHCDRVEVTDQNGYLQLVVTGARVTSLR